MTAVVGMRVLVVTVGLVPTDEMEADLFTKALDDATFTRHRDTVMNRAAA